MKYLDFVNKAGFVLKSGFYIKESNNYNLMLMEFQQGYVRVMGVIVCLEREVTKDEIKMLQKNADSKKIRYADNKSKSILMYSLDDLYGPTKEEKVEKAINNLFLFTNELMNMNIKNQSKCIFCGNDKEDEELIFDNYNGLYLPQHDSCRQQAKCQAVSKMNNENANTQMYPISILLAFGGAFLAALVINLLTSFVFNGTMYAITYALVPITAFFAYKLGKAPRNKNMIISVIVASVVATLLIDMIFLYHVALGYNMRFIDFLNENKTAVLGNEGMTLLFLAIGVWISWNIITKTNDSDVKKF